jgi:hypothetical protein
MTESADASDGVDGLRISRKGPLPVDMKRLVVFRKEDN